jgi:hypothetical protein
VHSIDTDQQDMLDSCVIVIVPRVSPRRGRDTESDQAERQGYRQKLLHHYVSPLIDSRVLEKKRRNTDLPGQEA